MVSLFNNYDTETVQIEAQSIKSFKKLLVYTEYNRQLNRLLVTDSPYL